MMVVADELDDHSRGCRPCTRPRWTPRRHKPPHGLELVSRGASFPPQNRRIAPPPCRRVVCSLVGAMTPEKVLNFRSECARPTGAMTWSDVALVTEIYSVRRPAHDGSGLNLHGLELTCYQLNVSVLSAMSSHGV